MSSNKRELRDKYKAVRLAMTADEVKYKSRIICQKLFDEVDWSDIKAISAFTPIAGLNEVDINPFLTMLEKDMPDIKIWRLGQKKPVDIPQQRFNLILVPTLAFDKNNHRLGWGGGFYDR